MELGELTRSQPDGQVAAVAQLSRRLSVFFGVINVSERLRCLSVSLFHVFSKEALM